MKLLPLLAAFLFAATTSRAPEPTTLQQLVEKAFTPPAPGATAPGRFLLHTSGHGHEADELTRRHIEYASAHIREAWIADDGQNATTPDLTHKAVAGFFRLQDKLEAMTAPVPLCK